MGTDYSPNNFLRKTPNSLLEQYFKKKGIEAKVEIEVEAEGDEKQTKTVKISELEEKRFEPILRLIESQQGDLKAEIEADFRDINERACKAGYLCLLDEARWEGHDMDISGDIEQMNNHYERAMWVFLNYPRVFKNSGQFQRMDGISFRKAFAMKGINPRQFDDDLEEFKQKLINHYKNEGRGKYCKIEVLKRTMPERYCYFAYLKDFGDTLDEFKGPVFKQTHITPAFKIVFVYHPDNGRIETSAKGKKEQIKELHEAFCQGVLKMDGFPDNNKSMHNLEKLKNRFNFMPRDPQDNIASVKLKYIELGVDSKRRISFTDNGKRTDIYNFIDDSLNKQNLPLETVKVLKARIQIVFRKMPQDRKTPSVLFEITPNRCSLKDSPLQLIGQKYIEKWGLIADQAIEDMVGEKEAEANAAVA